MNQIATDDREMQEVFRIAEELGVGVLEAADTLNAFRQVFSRPELDRQISEMIGKLDANAEARGEPGGLIVSYEVEVTCEGVKVRRCADEVPEGMVVEAKPADQAAIFLRIKEGFRTQKWLGPLLLRRPEPEVETVPERELTIRERFPESEWPEAIIYEMQPRWTLDERFPFLTENVCETRNALLFANIDTTTGRRFALAPLFNAASYSGLPASGLSPPMSIGERGHSGRKLSPDRHQ